MKLSKSTIYPVVLVLLMIGVYHYRTSKNEQQFNISGNTMGTYYSVMYKGSANLQKQIDSVLKDFNLSMSTYIAESEISEFNKNGFFKFKSPYFYPVLLKSKEVYNNSEGAFDPTVMPLVNAWGFGFKNKEKIDSTLIDSLLKFVGFNEIEFSETSVKSLKSGVTLDFSAIAKGYGVDVVGRFLESKNVQHYKVEIGGEILCKGLNFENKTWKIGVESPESEVVGDEKPVKIIELQNAAMATSGNYRNFYIDSLGVKRAHTINPKTGYPVSHNLLSVSVIAKDCMTADAYATAFMVLGLEKGKLLAEKLPDISVYFIYSEGEKLKYWSNQDVF